jgi:hypothetical protein
LKESLRQFGLDLMWVALMVQTARLQDVQLGILPENTHFLCSFVHDG